MKVFLTGLSHLFILTGCVFCLTASLGIFRFPDTLYRLHAASKGLTLGASFIVAGAFLLQGEWGGGRVKLLLIVLFFLVTNPVSAYAIARAYYHGHTRDEGGEMIDAENRRPRDGRKEQDNV